MIASRQAQDTAMIKTRTLGLPADMAGFLYHDRHLSVHIGKAIRSRPSAANMTIIFEAQRMEVEVAVEDAGSESV